MTDLEPHVLAYIAGIVDGEGSIATAESTWRKRRYVRVTVASTDRKLVEWHVRYLSGCNQCLVVPKVDKEGKKREGEWFDEQRLEVSGAPAIVLDNAKTPGFDAPAPKR